MELEIEFNQDLEDSLRLLTKDNAMFEDLFCEIELIGGVLF